MLTTLPKLPNPRIQLIILLGLALLLNVNTLFNEYSLDDIVVMVENKYVQKGVAGIPEIMSTDLMQGYSSKENLLEQKRYRPFSIVVFAIEFQIFGANPFVSHLVNVILFALLILVLFKILQKHIFKDHDPYLAFLTCLIFVVHPIHTEVIASVKSRDELLTFLLILTSLLCFLRWDESGKRSFLAGGLFVFFVALLTRESAVTFVAIFPLVLYYFRKREFFTSVKKSLGFLGVFIAYLILRYSVIGVAKPVVTDVLNAPYLLATPAQAFATKVFVLLKYILILIFPHPLSSDYSYNQIPYVGLWSFEFAISLIVLVALLVTAVRGFKSKTLVSFSVLYFFICLSLIANFLVDIGTPFSERLLFQASLSYCILLSFFILKLSNRSVVGAMIVFAVAVIFYSCKTISRNTDWKNNETLFFADVKSAPNSARTTLYALEVYRAKAQSERDTVLRKMYFDQAKVYGKRSLEIYPDFSITMLNLGFTYFYQADFDSTAYYWKRGYELNPSDTEAVKCVKVLSDIFYKRANGESESGNIKKAIASYKMSTDLYSGNTEAWYNLGGYYYYIGDTLAAEAAWSRVRALDPFHMFDKKEFFLQ